MTLLLLSLTRRAATAAPRWSRHVSSHRGTTPQTLRDLGPLRTRFAPSPTGYLHLGSLRTALFNYLAAKATGGQFILRLEDTDQKRTVADAEKRLYDDLRWAGIEWDEGPNKDGPYGPYKQSERTDIYRQHTGHLLRSGNAYRCFCSHERLHTLAEHRNSLGLPPDYDRACAHIPSEESDDRARRGESHVVRLRVPEKYPIYEDLVYGVIRQRGNIVSEKSKNQGFYEDPILLKSDGFPTYHLANVVDDHLMKITHVIRGTEWMSSTPKHLAMYEAFGWKPPAFAHVGLLVNDKRQKLSKRTGSIDIVSYRERGIFPEVLANFVALLGWSHYEKSDVMAMEDLIRNFSLKFTKGDAVVSFEKLSFLQRRHTARYAGISPFPAYQKNPQILMELALKPLLAALDNCQDQLPNLSFYQSITEDEALKDYVTSLLNADISNYTVPNEFIARNRFFFESPTADDLRSTLPSEGFVLKNVPAEAASTLSVDVLVSFTDQIRSLPLSDWNIATVKAQISKYVEKGVESSMGLYNGVEQSQETVKVIEKAWKKLVMQYLRWALMATKAGPETAETVRLLGKEEVLNRLELAEQVLSKNRVET